MEKLVSIIMPTYKGSKVVGKSLESLIVQSYSNIEIIVVDDNGKDSTEQKNTQKNIQKYLSDKRVNYIVHNINKNGSTARNTGIKNSHGDYIAFLDDDDMFSIDKIEKQVFYLENNPNIGMVYTGLTEIYKDGKQKKIFPKKTKDFLLNYLCGKLYVCSSSIMIRKAVINEVGFWDESFKRHQDMEYICRVANVTNVDFINESLVNKIIENRNLPTNAELIEKYRVHFLEKMDFLIKKYPRFIQNEIYFYNYIPISKGYLKNKKYIKGLKYAMKSMRPFKMIYIYVKDAIKYLRR